MPRQEAWEVLVVDDCYGVPSGLVRGVRPTDLADVATGGNLFLVDRSALVGELVEVFDGPTRTGSQPSLHVPYDVGLEGLEGFRSVERFRLLSLLVVVIAGSVDLTVDLGDELAVLLLPLLDLSTGVQRELLGVLLGCERSERFLVEELPVRLGSLLALGLLEVHHVLRKQPVLSVPEVGEDDTLSEAGEAGESLDVLHFITTESLVLLPVPWLDQSD